MTASFDNAALAYDKTFTNSLIGKLQRQQVCLHLKDILKNHKIKSVLEINCGTGEDALWLASKKLKVTATDISEKMLDIAKAKNFSGNLNFEIADINNLGKQYPEQTFDMIFSNFGGLNCLNPKEFETFFKNAAALLTPKGQLAIVIMPRNTLWEKFYFLAKNDFKNVSRRNHGSTDVDVDGHKVPTFYYTPKETLTLSSRYFHRLLLRPIGFFVPPSYLETYFKTKPALLSVFNKLDGFINKISFLAKYSDHYLIVFEKK